MNRRCLISTLRICTQIHSRKNALINSFNCKVPHSSQSLLWFTQRYFTTINELNEVTFDQVEELTKNKETVLIDVREPIELVEDGTIPGSINIPLGELEHALKNLPDDNFFKKYGHKKPDKNHTLIFSCRAGNRSKEAQKLALMLEYKKALNYSGGWTDWTEKSKS